MSIPRPLAAFASALVLAASAIGCGSGPTPAPATPTATTAATIGPSASPIASRTPGPSGGSTLPPDLAATYEQIAAQVSAIRGLDTPSHVEPVVIDADVLRHNLEVEFNQSNPPAEIDKTQQELQLLGLLPAGESLAQDYLDLQGSQVIGYYDPKVKELFLVSRDGGLGPLEEVTYAHEFTHELQDRHFNLDSLGLDTIKDNSDRVLAILSLVEGDAVSVQTTWMIQNLTAAELAAVSLAAADPTALAVLARTPKVLVETSLFPYQSGAAFVGQLLANGGYSSVNAAFGHLPASTEQILHPAAYLADQAPIAVPLPADLPARFGSGWTALAQDTLGELQSRVWLTQGGVLGDVARVAAEGWGGDRLELLQGPAGAAALVWLTTWDTAADAAEFDAAARTAIPGLGLRAAISSTTMSVAIAIGSMGGPSGVTLDGAASAAVAGH
jgi:hypothetical protein